MKHATGQDRGSEPTSRGDRADGRDRRRRDAGVPASGHEARRGTAVELAHQAAQRRPRVERDGSVGGINVQLVRAPRAGPGRPRERLELNRRLALVADLRADPAQRSDRVKQPPHARRPRRQLGRASDPPDGAPVSRAHRRAQRRGQRPRFAERLVHPGGGHPPRLAHRGRAARHRHRAQRAGALVAAQVADEQLAAPDRAVVAESGAVEDRPDGRARDPLLGEARGQVGMVMLDADQCHVVALERVLGRQVARMKIVGDESRHDREGPLEVLDALAVGGERRDVLEVADVMRDPGVRSARDAERGLLLGTARQQRARGVDRQPQRVRHVAARPAQQQWPPGVADPHGADHRVVGAGLDRAVVHAEQVGDLVQPSESIVVAVGDRLVGDVGAGHHQRVTGEVRQQQVVQRRVRQHHAELRGAGRHGAGHAARRHGAAPARSVAR